MRSLLPVLTALLVAACSSSPPPTPARTVTYGPASQSPSAATWTAPAPTRGAFFWHGRIADAQVQARREGKLILVGSTKPACGLCDKFKNQIVPGAGGEVGALAVGYMVDATQPESPQVWQTLRANLPTHRIMPLVGFLTPDLRWVTGFGGPTTVAEFRAVMARARRLHPVSARVPQAEGPWETAYVNEYGEYEWAPEGLWPEAEVAPEDALAPDALLAGEPSLPPAPAPQGVPSAPAAGPRPPAQAPPPRPVAAAPPPQAPPAPAPVATAPPPDLPPAPRPRAVAHDQSWGREALERARREIRRGDLEAAKATLAEVRARLPGGELGREAAKGSVAVYNAERIRGASGSEREQILESARRNLGDSMWGDLFAS